METSNEDKRSYRKEKNLEMVEIIVHFKFT